MNRALKSVVSALVSVISGASARGNLVEFEWSPAPVKIPQPAPAKRVPPPTSKMWGLKAAGGDVSWCGKSPETPEERHLKEASERLRRQLKWETKQNAQSK